MQTRIIENTRKWITFRSRSPYLVYISMETFVKKFSPTILLLTPPGFLIKVESVGTLMLSGEALGMTSGT